MHLHRLEDILVDITVVAVTSTIVAFVEAVFVAKIIHIPFDTPLFEYQFKKNS